MSNQLQQFQFDTAAVRVVTINNLPWFVVKDVCEAVGMNTTTGTSQWTRFLSDDEQLRMTAMLTAVVGDVDRGECAVRGERILARAVNIGDGVRPPAQRAGPF